MPNQRPPRLHQLLTATATLTLAGATLSYTLLETGSTWHP